MKTTFTTLVFYLLFILNHQMKGQSVLPYSQDFEGSAFLPAGWERFGSNASADWELNTSVGAYGQSLQCASFDNFSVNLTGNYYGMRAMALDLTDAVKPVMRFDVAYARRNATNSDVLGIWYSYNGTTGWINLISYQDGNLTTAPDQNTEFVPTTSQWDSITIDLTQFAGKPFVRFAFENNCRNGNVMYIDNVKFYETAFLGTGEVGALQSSLKLYPNPAVGGRAFLQTGVLRISTLQVTDVLGHVVEMPFTQESGNVLLNCSDLAPGIYTLSVTDDQGQFAQRKLLIQ